MLLSQALSTRDDLAHLEQRDPGLAGRFTELRDYLDQSQDDGASPVSLVLGSARLAPADLRPTTPDRRKLADELTRLLEQIRQLDGFASFGMPPVDRGVAGAGERRPDRDVQHQQAAAATRCCSLEDGIAVTRTA